ncbi:MAG TPA: tyrosine-protein phosphatase [Streptosporangiaceae bacterium]|nr:tyrosine-protein phosphatase [Streptosporangiaceae bacterium]
MMAATRVLLPDLVANFRDLGGIRTEDGRAVRPGRLLRTAALGHLAPAGLDALTGLVGQAWYFDLRTDPEVERDGGAEALVVRGWTWHRIPVREIEFDDGDPLSRYRANMARYSEVVDVLARGLIEHGSRPVVLGCSLGKDRTGMVVALLLHRLGVSLADIGADFESSNGCLAAQRRLLPARWREGARDFHQVRASLCRAALTAAPAAAPETVAALRRTLLVPSAGGEDEL